MKYISDDFSFPEPRRPSIVQRAENNKNDRSSVRLRRPEQNYLTRNSQLNRLSIKTNWEKKEEKMPETLRCQSDRKDSLECLEEQKKEKESSKIFHSLLFCLCQNKIKRLRLGSDESAKTSESRSDFFPTTSNSSDPIDPFNENTFFSMCNE